MNFLNSLQNGVNYIHQSTTDWINTHRPPISTASKIATVIGVGIGFYVIYNGRQALKH